MRSKEYSAARKKKKHSGARKKKKHSDARKRRKHKHLKCRRARKRRDVHSSPELPGIRPSTSRHVAPSIKQNPIHIDLTTATPSPAEDVIDLTQSEPDEPTQVNVESLNTSASQPILSKNVMYNPTPTVLPVAVAVPTLMLTSPLPNPGKQCYDERECSGSNKVSKSSMEETPRDRPNASHYESAGKQMYEYMWSSQRCNSLRSRRWTLTQFANQFAKLPSTKKAEYYGFSVACYNVLCQNLLEDNYYLYSKCQHHHLDWEYRGQNLIQEIREKLPDIICMQEVNEYHYLQCFRPILAQLGYESMYKKRSNNRINKMDGCATFFNRDIFQLVDSSLVEYFREGVWALDKDNVALILILETKSEKKKRLCIANTHLLFNPRRGDVRLAQLSVLLSEVDRLAYKGCQQDHRKPEYVPVIMTGDFNSEPHSDLYNLIRHNTLNYVGLDCDNISSRSPSRRVSNSTLAIDFLPERVQINSDCQNVKVCASRALSQLKRDNKKDTDEYHRLSTLCSIPLESRTHTPGVQKKKRKYDSAHETCKESSQGNLTDSSNQEAFGVWMPSSNTDAIEHMKATDVVSSNNESISEGVSSSLEHDTWPAIHNTGVLTHHFNFESVYDHKNGEITTRHEKANCTVDYIFYSAGPRVGVKDDVLSLFSKMDLPTRQNMHKSPLPNASVSSDHVMLMARFMLKL